MNNFWKASLVSLVVAIAAIEIFCAWFFFGFAAPHEGATGMGLRLPGMDGTPAISLAQAKAEAESLTAPVAGTPVKGPGTPSAIKGSWPCFRGEHLDIISTDPTPLARSWKDKGPPVLWELPMGQGYAAPVVVDGRVYVLDYDEEKQADTMRCLSLDDGKEIWRNSYPIEVTINHGISRTVSAVKDGVVVSLGPQCQVAGWDAVTGENLWLVDMRIDYRTKVPGWYAGQCPLVDGDRLIIAPAGPKGLVAALDLKTGKEIWNTPNTWGWGMTHASLTPIEIAGRRMYVYTAIEGVVGVAADTGEALWDTDLWKMVVSTSPSPMALPDGRLFFSRGYGKIGSLMLQVSLAGDKFKVEPLFELKSKQFNSEQQTPIFLDDRIYGVRKTDKRLVCMDLQGKEIWNSGKSRFGHGPYMMADGLIFAMNDKGVLAMAEASPERYNELDKAEIFIDGHDAWGPLVIVGGRLLLRDMTRLKCLDISEKTGSDGS